MRGNVYRLILMLLLVLQSAFACTCLENGPLCQSLYTYSDVFIASVLDKEALPEQYLLNRSYIPGYRYSMRVERSIRGTAGGVVAVVSGAGGGDCGYVFEVGKRYIIFGGPTGKDVKDVYGTSICSPTSQWSSEYESKIRRQVDSKRKSARVFGSIRERRKSGLDELRAPMAGVQILLSGGGERLSTTNNKGHYAFNGVSPGDYQLQVRPPHAYEIDWPQMEETPDGLPVKLEAAACRKQDFTLRVNGTVSGTVLDHSGKPLRRRSNVMSDVHLIPLSGSKPLTAYYSYLDENGSFIISGVPAGRYWLGFNVFSSATEQYPYWPTYYPGTSNRASATVVSLGKGEHLTGYDLRLPAPARALQIRVVVRQADGQPAGGTHLVNKHSDSQSGTISSRRVDAAGRSTIAGFSGEQETIHFWWNCPNSRQQLSGQTTFNPDEVVTSELQLTLPGACAE